jgi:epoxyqueuosine reductase
LNILLHICCAPCAIYPVEELKKESHAFAGFFYNPNIHPYSEYIRRKEEVLKRAQEAGYNVIVGAYDMEEYFQLTVYNEAQSRRCPICWWLRMAKAAKFAKENGFDAFTTTLLGSPYQDHEVLKGICEDVAKRTGIGFYYKDFRPGFKSAQETARSKGMYIQNYCGCIYSEKERFEKKAKGAKGGRKSKDA